MGKYFKRPVVVIGLLLVIVVVLGSFFYSNNAKSKVAKEFLNTYYNISDTNISHSKDIEELKSALSKKYQNILTEKALEKLAASRWILEGEQAANDFKCTLKVNKTSIKLIEDNKDNKKYDFIVDATVQYSDGSDKKISQSGALKIIKVGSKWLVEDVYVRTGELYKIMKK